MDWKKVGSHLANWAFGVVKNEVDSVLRESDDLIKLGDKLGIPWVPGEPLDEYRKKVIAARDAKR